VTRRRRRAQFARKRACIIILYIIIETNAAEDDDRAPSLEYARAATSLFDLFLRVRAAAELCTGETGSEENDKRKKMAAAAAENIRIGGGRWM